MYNTVKGVHNELTDKYNAACVQCPRELILDQFSRLIGLLKLNYMIGPLSDALCEQMFVLSSVD